MMWSRDMGRGLAEQGGKQEFNTRAVPTSQHEKVEIMTRNVM